MIGGEKAAAAAAVAAKEEMQCMRAREKEKNVAFGLFIADIYWLGNLRRRVYVLDIEKYLC